LRKETLHWTSVGHRPLDDARRRQRSQDKGGGESSPERRARGEAKTRAGRRCECGARGPGATAAASGGQGEEAMDRLHGRRSYRTSDGAPSLAVGRYKGRRRRMTKKIFVTLSHFSVVEIEKIFLVFFEMLNIMRF